MTKEQKEISDAYRSLFGLSPTTTQNEEESPEDKDRRLTREIQDSERRLQRLRDKRTSVLSYTPFHKRLRAVENFLLKQELSPLLEGYQAGYFSKGDRERIRFLFAPKGELRIAFEDEPIFPSFREAPKNSASVLYFVAGPDPSYIHRLEIYEDERDAVSHLENVEWEIVREEETLSDLQRELSDNRIEALMADIPLPSDKPRETVLSEIPAEEPPEEKETESGKRADPKSSGPHTEGGTDYEVGEEKEEDTGRSVQRPSRRLDTTENGDSGTPRQGSRKFHPNEYGGKELCIVVSYSKAGKRGLEKLANILTHKAKIQYPDYGDAQEWHLKNYKTFKSHVSKLRRKAKDEDWWDSIPRDYYESYS